LVHQGNQSTADQVEEADRRSDGAIKTVADLGGNWIKNVLRPANKNGKQDETYVNRDIVPKIGSVAVDDVSAADIWRCAEAVAKRGHGQAARRVRGVAKRMFDYALSHGIVRA
jgi:hypothetical protein